MIMENNTNLNTEDSIIITDQMVLDDGKIVGVKCLVCEELIEDFSVTPQFVTECCSKKCYIIYHKDN